MLLEQGQKKLSDAESEVTGLISEAKAGDYGLDPSRNKTFELGVKRVVKKFCSSTTEEGIYGSGSFKIKCL